MGRLVEQKGHKYLIQAASIVNSLCPQIYFVIVGDGPLKEELISLRKQLSLDHRVLFLGAQTDIENIIQMFDIFVQPSLWEGLPISIMESMAAMIPVITTDIPGCNYLIKNYLNGILVPASDSEALSKAIIELFKSKDLRDDIAQRGLVTLSNFDIRNIAQQYSRIYSTLINLNPAST